MYPCFVCRVHWSSLANLLRVNERLLQCGKLPLNVGAKNKQFLFWSANFNDSSWLLLLTLSEPPAVHSLSRLSTGVIQSLQHLVILSTNTAEEVPKTVKVNQLKCQEEFQVIAVYCRGTLIAPSTLYSSPVNYEDRFYLKHLTTTASININH